MLILLMLGRFLLRSFHSFIAFVLCLASFLFNSPTSIFLTYPLLPLLPHLLSSLFSHLSLSSSILLTPSLPPSRFFSLTPSLPFSLLSTPPSFHLLFPSVSSFLPHLSLLRPSFLSLSVISLAHSPRFNILSFPFLHHVCLPSSHPSTSSLSHNCILPFPPQP